MTCIPRLICSLLLISKFVPGLCCIDHLSALCTTHSAARRIVPDWKCALSPLEITNHGKRLVISSLDDQTSPSEKTTDETAQNVTKPRFPRNPARGKWQRGRVMLLHLCGCTKKVGSHRECPFVPTPVCQVCLNKERIHSPPCGLDWQL